MRRILIIGKDGQVGWELQRTLSPMGQVFALNRASLDLSDTDKIRDVIREIKPSLIVNSAAYTAVDKAESDQEMAHQINAIAPGILAEEAKKHDALLIHYSTDYVFDGLSKSPYKEQDKTAPINYYGLSKLEGEKSIQEVGGKHLILRTSWVYGMRGKNFLLTMLRLASERDNLKIVDDQLGAPTWSRLIAESTAQIAKINLDNFNHDLSGIYHLTSSGVTSWCGFAQAIFKHYSKGANKDFRVPQTKGITTSEYPTPAARPHYSVLSNDKIKNTFGIIMPNWEDALQLCLEN